MIDQTGEVGEGSPFLRTLHGGAGVPGSEVVTDGPGKIYKLGVQVGSCGNVFELEDSAFDEPALIKLYPRAAGIDERVVDAFAGTALRAAGLGHPQIARVFDAGALQNGTPFLIVERLPGETLKDLLFRRAALPLSDSLVILGAVGGALSAAHAAGIVHGELRPDNIFVFVDGRRDGRGGRVASVKLLDFGAALLTAPLRQMGINVSDDALSFLSPEQMQMQVGPEEWDGRTDEYALAVLAHRLLAYSQANRSPALTAVLTMAMNQRPGDRFISVDQFIGALTQVAGTGTLAAGGGARETLRPLSDLDVTPIGGDGLSLSPAARRTPVAHESNRSYGALTRQFFEDGNRMSEEASAARLRRPDFSVSASLSAMRIPTSAGRKVAVVVAAAAVIAVVAAAWAGVWNPVMLVRNRAHGLLSRPSPVVATAPAALPAAPAVTTAPAETTAPVATAVPSPPAAKSRAPAPAPVAAAIATPPSEAPPARPVVVEKPSAAKPPSAPAPANAAESAPEAAAPRHAHHTPRWEDPLHGYVWSPTAQRLVPSERAPEPPPSPSVEPSSTSSPTSSESASSSLTLTPTTIPTPPPPPPAVTTAPRTVSTPPPGTPLSSPLLDLPLPLSAMPTQPPPQQAPPIIDNSASPAKP